jgi:hypothetical protein
MAIETREVAARFTEDGLNDGSLWRSAAMAGLPRAACITVRLSG